MRSTTTTKIIALSALSLAVLLAGCVKKTHAPSPTAPLLDPDSLDTARAVVGAPDRTADDRALDAGRRPAELLTFIGVRPGMRVADLGAGLGYTTELLARTVGPTGVVYAQNNRFILEKF